MIQKPFDAITKADIDALIAAGVTERKTLEYKRELPGRSDEAKKEFLADVSSFANAAGGDVIYGIAEAVDADGKNTGTAGAVHPITGTTSDEAIRWLESVIGNGIAPRLPVHIQPVCGWGADGQGFVIVLRIPRSLASPHMVGFKNTSKFYSRGSAGKRRLDVGEIRAAFLATESQAERIRQFRADRLAKLVADEAPIPLAEEPQLVVHVIPITSFLENQRLDPAEMQRLRERAVLMGDGGVSTRHNLDGFLRWQAAGEHHAYAYCQLFRHGAIESVAAGTPIGEDLERNDRRVIYSNYEKYVVGAVRTCLAGYKEVSIIPPVAVALAWLKCKGRYLHMGRGYVPRVWGCPIDRDAVILPEVVIDELDVDVPQIMKPIFDMVWNACGYECSENYDTKGEWRPLRD